MGLRPLTSREDIFIHKSWTGDDETDPPTGDSVSSFFSLHRFWTDDDNLFGDECSDGDLSNLIVNPTLGLLSVQILFHKITITLGKG